MPPLSWYRLLLGWLKELFWILVFFLQLPLLWSYGPKGGRRDTPVIIACDFLCNPTMYLGLRSRLTKAGFPVFMMPPVGLFRGLRDQANRLNTALSKWNIRRGILIGHGVGALSALSLPDPGRRRIEHLLTIGAPFQGSRINIYIKFLPAMRDVSVGSEYLLLNRMNALLFPSFTPFSAWQDQWIVPFNLARFGQGRDMILDQVGHYNLTLGSENLATYMDFILERYPEAPPTQAETPAAAAAPPAEKAAPAGKAAAKKKAPVARGKTARKASKTTAKKKAPAAKSKAAKKKKTVKKSPRRR